MEAKNFDVEMLLKMRHSPIRNYVLPGLTSWLVGEPSAMGTLRMLVSERQHEENVVPHSHRFDFQCWVLLGWVRNVLWTPTDDWVTDADEFEKRQLAYERQPGRYAYKPEGLVGRWRPSETRYEAGQCYSMSYRQIHSIYFSRGAHVLFFEGQTVTLMTDILLPRSNAQTVETFRVEPWMFQKEQP